MAALAFAAVSQWPSTPAQAQGVPAYSHVFVIVMENKSYSEIIGSSAAPYINSLVPQGGLAASYFGVSHPSLPNYLALTGASTFGIASDCTTCWVSATNIGDTLEQKGNSWKAYQEGMPSPCFVGDSYPYMQKHDPFIYFNDIRTNASRCQSHVVPYSQLATDLSSAATTPNYAFITPDMCNDMHDCAVATGDAWLQQQVPAILGSPAFKTQSSLLVLTWDETDASGPNWVPLIMVGSGVGAGLQTSVTYDHYSLLHTIELAQGLSTLNSNDAGAAAMSDLFSSPTPTPTPTPTPPPPPSGACTAATIAPSIASPQNAGAQLTFSATSAGCTNPRYRFWELDPGSRWSMVQNYSAASTYTWRSPAVAGGYKFEVDVRDASESVAYDVVASTNYSLVPVNACTQPGLSVGPVSPGATAVTVTLSGSSASCPNPVYRFWVRDPGSRWSMVQDYSVATTHAWSQTWFAGLYSLEVDVRDASESTAYDAVANLTYVVNACTAANLNAAPNGATVSLTGAANCPGTATYRFWVRAPGSSWQVVQDYSTSNAFMWTPPAPGVYSLEVDVRDQNNIQSYEVVYNTTYSVA